MTRASSYVVHTPVAECEGCQWTDSARGAQGRAARHHDHTGHIVRVETAHVVTYGDRETALAAAGQTAMSIEETPAQ